MSSPHRQRTGRPPIRAIATAFPNLDLVENREAGIVRPVSLHHLQAKRNLEEQIELVRTVMADLEVAYLEYRQTIDPDEPA